MNSSKSLGLPFLLHIFVSIRFLLEEMADADSSKRLAIKDVEKPSLTNKQIR